MAEKLTYRELTLTITQIRDRLEAMDTFMTGIVAILGRDEVLQAAQDYAAEQAQRVEQALTEQVKSGVTDGWLKPTPVSGVKSLVVGIELSQGAPGPIRMQIVPEGLAPGDRGNYIGRQVGEEFIVQSPRGPVATKITEIYEVDQERRKVVIAERQAKIQAEAAAKKAAEAPPADDAPAVVPDTPDLPAPDADLV